MKTRNTFLTLLLCVPASLVPAIAPAQEPPNAPPTYIRAFSNVISEIRSVKWFEELCTESFPATAAANQPAYADWAKRHSAFIAEMEGHFEKVQRYRASQTDNPLPAPSLEQLKSGVEQQQTGFKSRLKLLGQEDLRKMCEGYPAALTTPRFDLEQSRKVPVDIVRKGPPAK